MGEEKTLLENFKEVVEAFKSLEDDHHNLDEFRVPLEYIVESLDNITQSDISEHCSELMIGLCGRLLNFIQGQFYWYLEANSDEKLSDLNEMLLELSDKIKW